jgi:hypothetical protein
MSFPRLRFAVLLLAALTLTMEAAHVLTSALGVWTPGGIRARALRTGVSSLVDSRPARFATDRVTRTRGGVNAKCHQ